MKLCMPSKLCKPLSFAVWLLAALPTQAVADEIAKVVRKYPNGKPAVVQIWDGPHHIRDDHFEADGAHLLEGRYSEDGRRIDWFQKRHNGSLVAQWATEDGKRSGDEQVFDEQGHRIRLTPWRDGKRHGRQQDFDEFGNVVGEISYSEDLPTGPQVTFYPTGERRSVCPLQDNRRHGVEIIYDMSGPKIAEMPYKFGVLDGEGRYFAPDGKVTATIPYRSGKTAGPETQFHPNGRKRAIIPLRPDGVREGDATLFAEDGVKSGIMPYKNGMANGWEMQWDNAGNRSLLIEWTKGVACCRVRRYWPSGRLQMSQEFIDLSKDGTEIQFYDQPTDNAMPIRQMQVLLVKGKKQGTSTTFYPDGQTILGELDYEDDMRQGLETRFHQDGKKMAEYRWNRDRLVGLARTYWPNGQLQTSYPFDDGAGTGMETRYDEHGKMRMQVPLVKGKKSGIARVFDDAGVVVATLTYADDVLDGPETRLRDGKPIGVWVWQAGELISSPPPEAVAAKSNEKPGETGDNVHVIGAADRTVPAAEVRESARSAAHYAAELDEQAEQPGAKKPAPPNTIRTYWPNGRLQSVYPVRGRGTEIQFHDNGEVSMVVPVLQGERNGMARIFDRSGALWAQVEFASGKKEGEETRYGKGGERVATLPFRHGAPVGVAKTYFADGALQSEYHHDPAQAAGTEIGYHRNGVMRLYVPLRFGKRNGTATIYTEAGAKWAEVPYTDGKRNGEERRYDKAGLVVQRLRWVSDKEQVAEKGAVAPK